MSIDVFFINQIPFLLTLGCNIYFTTVTHLANQKATTIFAEFKKIYQLYWERGFQIITVLADGQFAPLSQMMYELPGAPKLNLTSAYEHEPYIKRWIRVVKELTRAVRHSVPFTAIPKKMLTHMIFHVVKLLNFFPAKVECRNTSVPRQSSRARWYIASTTLCHSAPTVKFMRMINQGIAWRLTHRALFPWVLRRIRRVHIDFSI